MNHSIFALELCFRADLAPNMVANVRQRIKDHPEKASRDEKWRFYSGLSDVLLTNLQHAEKGCWDFFDENARAKKDYDMWVGGMTTREGARGQPSNSGGPYRGEPRYLTVTISFLIHNGTPSERALAEACNIWESNLWQRATFAKLLTDLRMLSFASVRSDVVYLIPRDEGWELTPKDLADEKFEYLRSIQG
jgi:hypothetical protein